MNRMENKDRAAAFEKVFRELYPRLCAYAVSIVRDEEDARDVVSQVFARLWEKEAGVEWSMDLKPYLYQCVYNAALNLIREEKVRSRFFEFLRQRGEVYEEEDDREENERLIVRLEETIERLPSQMKDVFLLNRVEGKTCVEIAKILGISVRTAENQVYRAMKFLREQLGGNSRDELLLLFLQDGCKALN